MVVARDLLVYVVTVSGFIDRQASILEQAKRHGLKIEFIFRYDPEAISKSDSLRCKTELLTLGAMSCVLKHIEAQKMLLARGEDYCLVLEDDAILDNLFFEKIAKVLELVERLEGPWLVFLGGMDNAFDKKFFNSKDLQLIKAPLTTAEAYLINRDSCTIRSEWLAKNLIYGPADHFLKDLDRQLGVLQLRAVPPFVTQGSITGRFSTSLDKSRANKPSWFLNIRYRWNRFRRHYVPSKTAIARRYVTRLLESTK